VLELDDLLTRLAGLDPRRAKVVEFKFFAGMTNDQIAEALGVARSTVATTGPSPGRGWRPSCRGSKELG
jgi:DNA-directed RNA polymerase specialized sigma24 family protein